MSSPRWFEHGLYLRQPVCIRLERILLVIKTKKCLDLRPYLQLRRTASMFDLETQTRSTCHQGWMQSSLRWEHGHLMVHRITANFVYRKSESRHALVRLLCMLWRCISHYLKPPMKPAWLLNMLSFYVPRLSTYADLVSVAEYFLSFRPKSCGSQFALIGSSIIREAHWRQFTFLCGSRESYSS